MIQSFSARFGRLDSDTEILFYFRLSDELLEAFGTQIGIQRNIFSQRFARNYTRYGRLLN
jgi:hypothetical protein